MRPGVLHCYSLLLSSTLFIAFFPLVHAHSPGSESVESSCGKFKYRSNVEHVTSLSRSIADDPVSSLLDDEDSSSEVGVNVSTPAAGIPPPAREHTPQPAPYSRTHSASAVASNTILPFGKDFISSHSQYSSYCSGEGLENSTSSYPSYVTPLHQNAQPPESPCSFPRYLVPLRLSVFLDPLYEGGLPEMSSSLAEKLIDATSIASDYIISTFKVKRICESNYLIARPSTSDWSSNFVGGCASTMSQPYCSFNKMPRNFMERTCLCGTVEGDRCQLYSDGTGLRYTDTALLVNFGESESCGPNTGAFAGYPCITMNNFRPLVGDLHFCNLGIEESTSLVQATSLILHEMLHSLGFHGDIFRYYKHDDGTSRRRSILYQGQAGAFIATPNVLDQTRDYFNCSTSMGILLENEGGIGSAGSHVEYNFQRQEIMNAISHRHAFPTIFAMMPLRDSGWYDINMEKLIDPDWGSEHTPVENRCEVSLGGCRRVARGNPLNEADCHSTRREDRVGCSLTGDIAQWCDDANGFWTGNCPMLWNYFALRETDEDLDYPRSCWNSVDQRFSSGEMFGSSSRCFRMREVGKPIEYGCYQYECVRTPGSTEFDPVVDHIRITATFADEKSVTVECDGSKRGTSVQINKDFSVICPNEAEEEHYCKNFPCVQGGIRRHSMCVCIPGYFGKYCQYDDTASMRSKHIHRLSYGDLNKVTMLVGGIFEIPASLYGVADHYYAVTPLPDGLRVDPKSGWILGSPTTENISCNPYTIAAVSGEDEARTTIHIRVVSTPPCRVNIYDNCAMFLYEFRVDRNPSHTPHTDEEIRYIEGIYKSWNSTRQGMEGIVFNTPSFFSNFFIGHSVDHKDMSIPSGFDGGRYIRSSPPPEETVIGRAVVDDAAKFNYIMLGIVFGSLALLLGVGIAMYIVKQKRRLP